MGLKPQKCPKCLREGAKRVLVHVDQKPVALVQERVALVQNRVALMQNTLGGPSLQLVWVRPRPIFLEAHRGPMQLKPGLKGPPRKQNGGPVRGTDGPVRGTEGPVTGTAAPFKCTKSLSTVPLPLTVLIVGVRAGL